MISRWLLPEHSKRKRRRRSKILTGFRIETLERRYCMANDFDVSPIPIHPNDVSLTAVVFANSSMVDRRQTSVPNCEVPVSFAIDIQDSEYCFDNFVGARYVAFRLAPGNAFQSVTLDLVAPQNNFNDAPQAAAVDGVFGASGADALRPNLPGIQQMTVAEGEGPAHLVLTTPHGEAAISHVVQPSIGKNTFGATGSGALTAGFVTSIDRSASATSSGDVSDSPGNYSPGNDSLSNDSPGSVAEASWSGAGPRQEGKQVSLIEQSARQSSWTGLVAERALPFGLDASLSEYETRPHLTIVPGRQLNETTRSDAMTDVPGRHTRLVNARKTESPRTFDAAITPPGIPVIVANTNTDSSDMVGETVIALLVEDGLDTKDKSPSASTPPSRYWFLAAIPFFFAIPRRVKPLQPRRPGLQPGR